ncbi:acetyl-coenzyme A transporter 1 [Circinella umbellata]|nr:acetyl-coenzyme A transporter 1 [Circinella umbellata]
MPTAYVYPTLDDEPIVPIVTTSQTNNNTTNEQSTNKSYTSTTAMDPTITAATTQRRKEIPISEDDKEELELDYLENEKESSIGNDNDTSSYQPETLRREDLGNFILLVILYLLQGVPVGLSFGSIPFLLKEQLSYSQIAIFSLSSWPYSLKFLWSPIVDAVYSPTVGRRKSWIIPIQLMTGFLFVLLSQRIDALMEAEHIPIYYLTGAFLVTIFFCATQDIAVDGWALTLLSKDSLSYASTAQTIGLNTGYFLSFTVFLALSSPEFSNRYIWSEPQKYGILRLGGYMRFWAIMYFAVTAWLTFMKKETASQTDEDQLGIRGVYNTIWKICKLSHLRSFIVVLLTAKIGFICHEAVTSLKLLEKGFSKEDLALSVLLDFPLQIFFGYYAAKWSNGPRPLKPWLWGFYGRLLFSAVGMLVVYFYPSGKDIGFFYFAIIMGSTVLSSFMSTIQFVSISAFMTSIADPLIGGTYMTLLNTFSNFGGTWPKFFVLESVDYFTEATCSVPDANGLEFSCIGETGAPQCKEFGGTCVIHQDGYYTAGIVCVIAGFILLEGYIRPTIYHLEGLSKRAWKISR